MIFLEFYRISAIVWVDVVKSKDWNVVKNNFREICVQLIEKLISKLSLDNSLLGMLWTHGEFCFEFVFFFFMANTTQVHWQVRRIASKMIKISVINLNRDENWGRNWTQTKCQRQKWKRCYWVASSICKSVWMLYCVVNEILTIWCYLSKNLC